MSRTRARTTLLAAGLLLAVAGGACAADDAALRVVEACRARLDARIDVGVERIQKRCPDLLPAIAAAPWHALVPPTLRERREELSAESLRALVELIRGAGAATAAGVPRASPDVAQLAPILAELGAHGQEGVTRWERFKRWLKDLRNGRKDDDEGWLTRWSRELSTSEGVARIVSYVGYGLLAALALFVIWAELRAAGLFSARRRAAARNSPEAQWRRRLMLADVGAAPLAERPGMLLRLLGEALTRAQRLPAADGLTAAAIARRARLDAEADRAELARVAAMSDQVRYAGRMPADDDLERTVTSARALLARFAKLGGRH
jgi:hypothetical protein